MKAGDFRRKADGSYFAQLIRRPIMLPGIFKSLHSNTSFIIL